MNEEKITLLKITEIKEKAEAYIAEIIKAVEKETGCFCQDIDMYVDSEAENKDSLVIDINLRIPFKKLE